MNVKKTSQFVLGMSIKIVMAIAIVTVMYIGCIKAFEFGDAIFDEGPIEQTARNVVITIPAGATESEVAKILQDNGLIESKLVFWVQTILYEGEYHSGTFVIDTGKGPEEMIAALSYVEVDDEE